MIFERAYLSFAASVLIAPAMAMMFTPEVAWGAGDFAAAAALLALGWILTKAAGRLPSRQGRIAASALALIGVAAVWAHLAVGIWS